MPRLFCLLTLPPILLPAGVGGIAGRLG
jgi:hypothetical protein